MKGKEKAVSSSLFLCKACAPIDWFARLYIETESNDFMINEVPVRQQFDIKQLIPCFGILRLYSNNFKELHSMSMNSSV